MSLYVLVSLGSFSASFRIGRDDEGEPGQDSSLDSLVERADTESETTLPLGFRPGVSGSL